MPVDDPWPNDVLMGREKLGHQRAGNVHFREMLDKHMDKYEHGEKGVKSTVTTCILHLVKQELDSWFLKELQYRSLVEADEATVQLERKWTMLFLQRHSERTKASYAEKCRHFLSVL